MIEARHLVKRFGAFTAVADVSLRVEPGQVLALLGPNGAGKTTTVRMLAALLRPTAGTATVRGYDTVAQAAAVRHAVGLLTELPGLYSRMSALDYLEFFARLYQMQTAEYLQQAEHLLRYFGLWGDRARPIGTYSKGMRQKVALARALLHSPAVVLLDEPTSAMDPASAKTVRDYIRGLKQRQRAILLCTHNLAEAEALADYIAIIQRGRVVAYGTSEQLKRELLGVPAFEIRLAQPVVPTSPFLDGLLTIEQWEATWVRYSTTQPEVVNPRFVQHLVQAGAQVLSVGPVPQSLEDVYLRMVEGAE